MTVRSSPLGDQAKPKRGEMLIASVSRKIWCRPAAMIELYGVSGDNCPNPASVSNGAVSSDAQLFWQTGLELCSARKARVSFRDLLTRHSSCPYTPSPHSATGCEAAVGKVWRYCTASPLNRSAGVAMNTSGLLRTLKV